MTDDRSDQYVHLFGVGDVGPIHEPLGRFSELVRDRLKTADIRFAQCERVYTERGAMQVHSGGHNSRQHPRMASIFPEAGFNVVSLASNHALDWGPDAMLDTKALFEGMGIKVIGAGANIEEARQPAIFDVNGVRVGLLGYCSVGRDGYYATDVTPGIAPMRARTFYEPTEYQAGTPPRVITIPYQEDVEAMCEDIAALSEKVDNVVLSFHWGIHNVPKMIADYQLTVAKAAIENGADLILTHHAHVPKGIQRINGKICFQGLGNFMFTTSSRAENKPGHHFHDVTERYGIEQDLDYPTMPYGKDGHKSMIASAVFDKDGVVRVSFLPVLIDKDLRTEIIFNGDPRFTELVDYIDWLSSDVEHEFRIDGDEVVVAERAGATV